MPLKTRTYQTTETPWGDCIIPVLHLNYAWTYFTNRAVTLRFPPLASFKTFIITVAQHEIRCSSKMCSVSMWMRFHTSDSGFLLHPYAFLFLFYYASLAQCTDTMICINVNHVPQARFTYIKCLMRFGATALLGSAEVGLNSTLLTNSRL